MSCGDCTHWRTGPQRGGKEMAGLGYGVCGARLDQFEWVGRYLPFGHPACDRIERIDAETRKVRKDYLRRQDARRDRMFRQEVESV